MTSRERIINTLQHKEPDKIPIDLGATDSSGITAIAYNKLKKELGLSSPTQIIDIGQMIAKVDFRILGKIGVDAVPLLIEPRKWKKFILYDGSEVEIPEKLILKKDKNENLLILDMEGNEVKKCPKNGLYFDNIFNPLKNIKKIEEIVDADFFKSYDWPYYLDENYNELSQKAKNLYSTTDYAVVGNLYVHLLAAGQDLRGFENFMMDLVMDKKLAHYILSKQLEAYLERINKYVDAVGSHVDIIQVNDDLGTQNSLQFSIELYREMLKPYHKKLWQYIKEKSKKPILLHSCGSIYELIPDFIEMGIDALNPVQVSAKNMDTKKLKKEYGDYIAFWGGGCDTQKVLSNGTPDEVKQEVRRRVDDLAPGGGFVFCQVHNIQPDVPIQNILAMYEELSNYQ